MFDRRITWLVLTLLFALNVAILRLLHIGVRDQIAVDAVLLVLTLAGLPLAVRLRPAVDDPIIVMACAFWTGIIAYTALCWLLLHRVMLHLLGTSDVARGAQVALLLMLLPCSWSIRNLLIGRARFRLPPLAGADRWPAVAAAAIALAMSVATIDGIFNETSDLRQETLPGVYASWGKWPPIEIGELPGPVRNSSLPDWGADGDYLVQLVGFPRELHESALPPREVRHLGTSIFHLAAWTALLSYHDLGALFAAKIAASFVWFTLLYGGYFLGRRLFALPQVASWVLLPSCAVFAAINWPPWRTDRSSYLGLVNSACALYHNGTQLFSVAIGMIAVCLIGKAMRRKDAGWCYLVGCLLGAGSFFFKPSLFTVFAPAAVLTYPWYIGRRQWQSYAGLLVLFVPVVAWKLYARWFATSSLRVDWEFSPFWYLFSNSWWRFSPAIQSHRALAVLFILVLSFAAFIPPVLERCVRLPQLLKGLSLARLHAMLSEFTFEIFLGLMFFGGIASITLFVETGPARGYGNFTWAAAAAYLIALPGLYALIWRSRTLAARLISWLTLPFHLGAGLIHLYLFVTLGNL